MGDNEPMSIEIVSEPDDDDADLQVQPAAAHGFKHYMTRPGYQRLRTELLTLLDEERPKVVEVVHWAASNGDRSENGDYLYGKKRLREIDRRIRYLTHRLDKAEVVDPSVHHGRDQVFLGATVVYARADGSEVTVTIVGVDEADPLQGCISWVSPVACALIKAREGDTVRLQTPLGIDTLEVLTVHYPSPTD